MIVRHDLVVLRCIEEDEVYCSYGCPKCTKKVIVLSLRITKAYTCRLLAMFLLEYTLVS